MLASTEARELEENLSGVEASVGDLIGAEEVEDMARKTWDFGTSLMTQEMIEVLEEKGYIPKEKASLPKGETIPRPGAADAVVFKDFFACGLRFSAVRFLREVLESFKVQLHHLTPNGILTLNKFSWAYESYGVELVWILFVSTTSSSGSLSRWTTRSLKRSMVAVPSWRRGSKRSQSWRYPSARRISGRRSGCTTGSM